MHSNHTDEGAASASAPGQSESLSAAHALIAQDAQQRMEACAAEIQEVLARHGMRLDLIPAQITIAPA